MSRVTFEVQKDVALIGYEPKIKVRDGLKATYAAFKAAYS